MVEQLNILRESLHDYHERVKSQRELRGLLKQVQSRAARLKAYDRKLSHERRQLRSTERKSARELALRRQLMDEKGKLLNRERAELVDRINVQRQRLETRPAALALIDLSPGELDSRLDNLSTQLNALQDELPVKYELRGTLRQQKREAEQQAKPRSKGTTPWPDLIAKADEVTKTWQKVTEHTDAQVAALRRHQRPTVGPRHLQVAGDYLRRLTDGRWSQVTLIGEPASLQVGHAQGSSVGVMELPEKELFDLLFSLWLAQLDMLAEQRVKLPIILEDPLGMTSHSPLAAAKVLRDFAATGHQLILTTSQPEHAEWFADLEVPIANFAIRRATTGRASRKSEMDDPAQHRRTRRKKGRETPTIPPEDEAGDTVNDPWGNAISSLG